MFYTYIYRDPSRNNEPIYVGKGHGRRSHCHLTRKDRHPFVQRLQKMAKDGIAPTIEVIPALNEEHAYFLEECLVPIFGRKDKGTGTLLNISDGGRGISKGTIRSPETRAKISAAQIGKKLSPEHRANIAKGGTGWRHTEESKRAISEKNTGKQRTDAQRATISAGLRGKPWTPAQHAARAASVARKAQT